MTLHDLQIGSLNLNDLNATLNYVQGRQVTDWGGNVPTSRLSGVYILSATLSPALVAANTTAEQTFTVGKLSLGSVVFVNKPTAQAGLGIVGARVSATNILAITFSNNTAAGITPTASEKYLVGVIANA